MVPALLLLLVVALAVRSGLGEQAEKQASGALFPGAGFDAPRRSLVLIISRLGFANRVRAMADWHQLARFSGRELIVSWEPTLDCNATFSDLFQAGPPGFRVLPFALPAGTRGGLEVVVNMATEFGLTSAILRETQEAAQEEAWANGSGLGMFAAGHSTFVVSKRVLKSQVDVLVTDYVGVTIQQDLNCQPYLHLHAEFLRALVPNAYAQEVVTNIKTRYFSDRMLVGVHVRAHDPVQDWAVVPPVHSSDPTRAVNFGVGATVEHFVHFMRQIESGLPNQQVRFFIASNDPAVKQRVLSHFADAVILNGEYSRELTQGLQFALIEWLILAESALILNTHGSSFAVEAAQVHQRPLVGIYDGRLLHLYNQYLPFCAHLLYLKTYAQQGHDEVYVENDGASFQRSIVGRHIVMRPCNYLREWGLLEVFCVNSDDDAARGGGGGGEEK